MKEQELTDEMLQAAAGQVRSAMLDQLPTPEECDRMPIIQEDAAAELLADSAAQKRFLHRTALGLAAAALAIVVGVCWMQAGIAQTQEPAIWWDEQYDALRGNAAAPGSQGAASGDSRPSGGVSAYSYQYGFDGLIDPMIVEESQQYRPSMEVSGDAGEQKLTALTPETEIVP